MRTLQQRLVLLLTIFTIIAGWWNSIYAREFIIIETPEVPYKFDG